MRPDEYEARYQELREQMGLNDPIIVRYGRWIGFLPEKGTTDWNGPCCRATCRLLSVS